MKKLLSDDSQIVKDDMFVSFQPLRIKYTPTRRASIGATKNRSPITPISASIATVCAKVSQGHRPG
jgi:hypothetical protein